MAYRSELVRALALAALCVAAVGGISSVARAQRAEPESADALIDRGRALRLAHDDEAALGVFERAYALSPTPRAEAQIGYAELALGRWVEGEARLEAAFGHTADAWIASADARAGYEAARAQIARHVSDLAVVVDVEGATIEIGDRVVGTSPLAGTVRVEVGEATVRARLAGYEDAVERVTIQASLPSRVELVLAPSGSSTGAPAVVDHSGEDVTMAVRVIGLAVGGLALAGGIAATAVVATNNDGLARCDYGPLDPCAGWRSDVRVAETFQWVGYAVGGVLLVGGLVALVVGALVRHDEPARESAFRCEPGLVGVACVGHF